MTAIYIWLTVLTMMFIVMFLVIDRVDGNHKKSYLSLVNENKYIQQALEDIRTDIEEEDSGGLDESVKKLIQTLGALVHEFGEDEIVLPYFKVMPFIEGNVIVDAGRDENGDFVIRVR